MPLSTDWSRSLGLKAPIVNAPMGGVAGGALAAAVSRAGGLGMIGIGSAGTPEQLETELGMVSGLELPYGIGLVGWVLERHPELLTVALAARPAVLCVSFGEDFTWVRRARDAGVLSATQVGDLRGARQAVDAGVDILVARGAEGGGHGDPGVGTLPLLAAMLDEVAVPVLAAGGISGGRALAAVLAAGAAGAWVGTALAAATEAATSDEARHALFEATETDTVTTRVFDIAQGYPWPEHLPERVLRNGFSERWTGHEGDLAAAEVTRAEFGAALAAGDPRQAPVNAGQGVGKLRAIQPAAQVIAELCADAHTLLARW